MSDPTQADEARLLTVAEQEAVSLTQHPAIAGLSRQELQALARRLREARYRARDIARQQRREMRGKAEPRGATPARDNTGTVAKGEVLAEALERVTQELRRIRSAGQASPVSAAPAPALKPSGGPPAESKGRKAATARPTSQEVRAKPSKLPTVRSDPREVGRVSKAVKSAQARRDAKPR